MSLGDELKRAYFKGALEGIRASALDLEGRSIEDAPIEEGTLRGSFALAYLVDNVRFEGPGAFERALDAMLRAPGEVTVEAEVSANTVYAAAIHEAHAIMHRNGKTYEWRARNFPRGGGPKYLEKNLLAQAARYERVIGASAERGLEDEARKHR